MQGERDVFGDEEAGQAAATAAEVFETPRGGIGLNPDDLSTTQFRAARRTGTVVDQLFGDLPRRISDHFSVPRGDEEVNISRFGLENVPEEEEEEEPVVEEEKEEVNMSKWDASRIDPDGLDGASFLYDDPPFVRRDNRGQPPRVSVPPPRPEVRTPPQPILRRTVASSTPKSAQAAKFVRFDDVPDSEMLEGQVVLRREDYSEPGSSEYRKNMQMATHPLTEKFGVAKHKIIANAEDGDQTKSMHVQQAIVSILHRVKEGLQRSKSMDWMEICVLPRMRGNPNSTNPADWWDSSQITIWSEWEKTNDKEVRAWQYCINKRFSSENRTASTWLKEFVYNSSTDALRTAVTKRYERLPDAQLGGVVYLYYTLCEMFEMSREVKEAMISFIDFFKKKGVARYTGENILVVQEELLGVCRRLDAVGALTEEHVMDILTGLSICGNIRFRKKYEHLKQGAEFNLFPLEGVSMYSSPLDKVEGLDNAATTYSSFCLANQWLKVTKQNLAGVVATVNACWNCGEEGHGVGKCPKPKDQARITKNKEAFEKNKSGRNTSGGTRTSGKKDKSEKRNDPDYQHKVWANSGISMVNGVLMLHCKTCGYNTTHGTKLHDAWSSNPTSFRLSENHMYEREKKKLGQSGPSPMVNPSTQPQQSTPAVPSTMISFTRAELEAKLSAVERTSTNPNASELSEYFRSVFLN
eukprot:scaffold13164_cov56-Cyclotella_meneghiniana.AAC.1